MDKNMKCGNCSYELPPHDVLCPVCHEYAGFPNVRAAEQESERAALAKRERNAEISTQARGCFDILQKFKSQIENSSKAIIARDIITVHKLVSEDNVLYPTFHQQVTGQSRIPQDNNWDKGRTAVESTLFPHYYEHIRFGSLSLEIQILSNYGRYVIVLKDAMIRNRASVFEENPFNFCRKHNIITGSCIPEGYRATWNQRQSLAIAKLHSKIEKTTQSIDFSGILLCSGEDGASDEFIEVHIYGPIHRMAIEKVIGPSPTTKEDKVFWKSIKKRLRDIGASVEEI